MMTTTIQQTTAVPPTIDGWLTHEERAMLARYAEGRQVLEIGSYCGLSTVWMAREAARVVCVDPLDGRATPRARDTEAELRANLARYGVDHLVDVRRGTTLEVVPGLAGPFDFAFIDGAHDYRSVLLDYYHTLTRLADGGLVAFHDYASPIDEPVTRAVSRILYDGATVVERVGTVLIVRPGPRRPLCVPYLGIPTATGLLDHRTARAAAEAREAFPLATGGESQCSLLAYNFNYLLAEALNGRKHGVTHLFVLHDDVIPLRSNLGDWASVLVGYMDRFGLGAIAAAVPLKIGDGMESSTAIDGSPPRRLRMDEIPPLLTSREVHGLLINTGCLALDLRTPGVEDLVFSVRDRMDRDADGRLVPGFEPEDWEMSRWLTARGVAIGVTTDVRCLHAGRRAWGA